MKGKKTLYYPLNDVIVPEWEQGKTGVRKNLRGGSHCRWKEKEQKTGWNVIRLQGNQKRSTGVIKDLLKKWVREEGQFTAKNRSRTR